MSGPDSDPLRLVYRVLGTDAADASQRAKARCREEGWTLRTVASVRQAATPGQWLVTLVVRPAHIVPA